MLLDLGSYNQILPVTTGLGNDVRPKHWEQAKIRSCPLETLCYSRDNSDKHVKWTYHSCVRESLQSPLFLCPWKKSWCIIQSSCTTKRHYYRVFISAQRHLSVCILDLVSYANFGRAFAVANLWSEDVDTPNILHALWEIRAKSIYGSSCTLSPDWNSRSR